MSSVLIVNSVGLGVNAYELLTLAWLYLLILSRTKISSIDLQGVNKNV